MKTRRLAVLVAGLALLTSGCGEATESPGPGGADRVLGGRTFLSTAVTEGGVPRKLAKGTRVSLQFTDDGRLIADAGCNSMQGPVSTGDGRLRIADLAMTEMGCDQPRHAQDDWLARALGAEPAWRIDTDTLTVTSGTTTLVLLDRKLAEPDLPLEGTKWTLDSVVDGEAVSHQAGSERAYLRFAAGKVTGSTGCNSLTGAATVSGSSITFGPIGTTRRACTGDPATLEQAVLRVLKGSVSLEIDSSRLSLRHGSGHGLVLTGS